MNAGVVITEHHIEWKDEAKVHKGGNTKARNLSTLAKNMGSTRKRMAPAKDIDFISSEFVSVSGNVSIFLSRRRRRCWAP